MGFIEDPRIQNPASANADLLLIIKDQIGDRAAISVFDGIYYKKTTMIIAQDFIFDRYIYAHEFGHLLGCGHEADSSEF